MPERQAGLRGLKRAPADHPVYGLPFFHELAELPTPTYPVDVSGGITDWQMLGNGPDPTLHVNDGQPVGDCTFAGRQHLKMAVAKAVGATESWETTDQLVTEYLAYDDGQDEGANIPDLLLAWYKAGKILGFARVNHANAEQSDAAMAVGHGLYCGVSLTDDADELFGEHLAWNTAKGQQPDPQDGHCILKVKANPTEDTYVTWGTLQGATRQWTAACLDEAYILFVSEDQVSAPVLTAVRSAIDALDGQEVAAKPKPSPKPKPRHRKRWLGRRPMSDVPTPPPDWTSPSADIAYVAALVLFGLGVLTAVGVTVPTNVSSMVQEIAAAAQTIAGGIVALLGVISKHSVQRAALQAHLNSAHRA